MSSLLEQTGELALNWRVFISAKGGRSLAVDLKDRGIAVALLHPGYVKTRMVNFGGLITPEESAAGLAQRIAELNLENSGSFRHSNGEELPW